MRNSRLAIRRKRWIARGVLMGLVAFGVGLAITAKSDARGEDLDNAELAAVGETPSRTLAYVGKGANGCRAAGSLDFEDDGDRFTVHDYCKDGYHLEAWFFNPAEPSPRFPLLQIINDNGLDGAPETQTFDLFKHAGYEVVLVLMNGEDLLESSDAVTLIE